LFCTTLDLLQTRFAVSCAPPPALLRTRLHCARFVLYAHSTGCAARGFAWLHRARIITPPRPHFRGSCIRTSRLRAPLSLPRLYTLGLRNSLHCALRWFGLHSTPAGLYAPRGLVLARHSLSARIPSFCTACNTGHLAVLAPQFSVASPAVLWTSAQALVRLFARCIALVLLLHRFHIPSSLRLCASPRAPPHHTVFVHCCTWFGLPAALHNTLSRTASACVRFFLHFAYLPYAVHRRTYGSRTHAVPFRGHGRFYAHCAVAGRPPVYLRRARAAALSTFIFSSLLRVHHAFWLPGPLFIWFGITATTLDLFPHTWLRHACISMRTLAVTRFACFLSCWFRNTSPAPHHVPRRIAGFARLCVCACFSHARTFLGFAFHAPYRALRLTTTLYSRRFAHVVRCAQNAPPLCTPFSAGLPVQDLARLTAFLLVCAYKPLPRDAPPRFSGSGTRSAPRYLAIPALRTHPSRAGHHTALPLLTRYGCRVDFASRAPQRCYHAATSATFTACIPASGFSSAPLFMRTAWITRTSFTTRYKTSWHHIPLDGSAPLHRRDIVYNDLRAMPHASRSSAERAWVLYVTTFLSQRSRTRSRSPHHDSRAATAHASPCIYRSPAFRVPLHTFTATMVYILFLGLLDTLLCTTGWTAAPPPQVASRTYRCGCTAPRTAQYGFIFICALLVHALLHGLTASACA